METSEITGQMIDRLVTVEMRNILRGVVVGMYEEAHRKVGHSLTMSAAKRLATVGKENGLIVISTGWVIPDVLPVGETDGPPGAVALSRAMQVGLLSRTLMVSEPTVVPVLDAVSRAGNVLMRDVEDVKSKRPVSSAVTSFPIDKNEATKQADALLDQFDPDAIITLEKGGRNEKGVYHTGQGGDMSQATAKVDLLVDAARRRGILTIGIADTGNEIGVGNIYDETINVWERTGIPWARKCNCPCGGTPISTVEVDNLIVSASCNKGAYGLEASLAYVLDKPEVLHDAELHRRIAERMSDSGVGDGALIVNSLTEDGVPLKYTQYLLEELKFIIGLSPKPPVFHEIFRLNPKM